MTKQIHFLTALLVFIRCLMAGPGAAPTAPDAAAAQSAVPTVSAASVSDSVASASVTRGLLAEALYRMNGSPNAGSASFADVPKDAAYAEAAAWANQSDLMPVDAQGQFHPNDTLSIGEAVTVLWKMAGAPEAGQDAEQSALRWAQDNGILEGIQQTQNAFDPSRPITRAETVSMLSKYIKLPGSTPAATPTPSHTSETNTLVAYFSATGTTRPIADDITELLNADLYEIVPAVPYTEEDLAYYTNSRADREQSDPSARPQIAGDIPSIDNYDAIFLGYPIWHGQAPRIISTFLESSNFAGKTIVPFCTSHSSGLGQSAANLHALAPDAHWLEGKRFSAGTTEEEIEAWLSTLDLPAADEELADAIPGAFNFETKSVQLNSGYEMPINGLGTYSLHGDTCVNAIKSALASGVRLIDTASAYGNEVEVGQAVREAAEELGIPREEIFVVTKIYPGSEMANPEQAIQACLDRLDIGYVDMMLLHHPDPNDVAAYKAMEKFVESGQIRSLGLSNWYVSELEDFLPQVETTPALVQNEIHPYYQENDVIPYIQDLGIVVEGWYPLGGRGHTAELLGDEVITAIAEKHGVSAAQVILRWNLQKGVVVIPGSSNPDHIKENTKLYDFVLTDDEMEQINALDRHEKHDWY